MADSLFRQGQYLAARVLYEELLFRQEGLAAGLLLKKSFCYKAEGKYEDGLRTLQRADFFSAPDSLQYPLRYEAALHAFLAGRNDLAAGFFAELNHYVPHQRRVQDVALEVMNLHAQKKIAEAQAVFEAWAQHAGYGGASPYQNWRGLKNPVRAENRSYVFPGLGQMYAGHCLRGITSLALQGAAMAFAAASALNGYYLSAMFTGGGLFYMFYTGGARHAGFLAEQTNQRRLAALDQKLLQSMMP